MKIIEDLYYGNVKMGKASKEQLEIIHLIDKNEQRLKDTLTQKQKDILQKLIDCYDELCDISAREAYILGFSLGTKIIIESVTI